MSSTISPEPQPISDEALRFKDLVRSADDLQRLSDYGRRMYMPLVLSALLPIVVAAGNAATDSRVSVIVNVASWIVFVVDLAVHRRLVIGYMKSRVGRFDLFIVILTAPWFLIPGFGATQILVLARLARLVRLLFVSKGARRAATQLGRVGILSMSMLLFGSWMAYVAEHPTNPQFDTFGDALWWGIATLTTVGYGDIVPITEQGRIAGTILMFTGIATLGLISGSLAGAFGFADKADGAHSAAAANGPQTPDLAVASELADLRAQRVAIDQRLALLVPTDDPDAV